MCNPRRPDTASSARNCFRPSTPAPSRKWSDFLLVCSAPPVTTGGSILRFYDVGVGFTNYELDLFGRLRSLNHVALQQYFSFGETRRSAELTLVAEVANAYLTVLADETLLQITRETLKNQSDSYALTQRLFSGGTST